MILLVGECGDEVLAGWKEAVVFELMGMSERQVDAVKTTTVSEASQ